MSIDGQFGFEYLGSNQDSGRGADQSSEFREPTYIGVWRTVKSGASNLKVDIALTCTGEESTVISRDLLIEDLGKIRFKWDAKVCKDDSVPEITCNFSVSKCDMNDDRIIKTNIVCEQLKYSETDIHTPNNWTDWILMGSKKPTSKSSHPQVSCTLVNILITMYEVKTDKTSPISYSDTEFTDFQLCTEEGSVPVHKACLAGHSDVFKAMLRGEWKETSEGQIKVKGVTLKTLQQLKDYMYLGTLPADDTPSLRPLLLIARCYLIEDLEKHCIRKLAEEVTPEELFSLIDFACENQIPELPFTLLQLTKDTVIVKAHQIKKGAGLKNEANNTSNDD